MKKPQRIPNNSGWVLIVRDESDPETGARKGPWYIGWNEVFTTRNLAKHFANSNNWIGPWRAVRAKIVVLKPV